MELPVVFISENPLIFAPLRQEIGKEQGFAAEGRVRGFEEGVECLQTKEGHVLALFDLGRHPQKSLAIAEEIRLKFPNVHLVMTAPDHDPRTLLGAMRSGAEEFLTQPFDWPDVLRSLKEIREKISHRSANGVAPGRIITVYANKGGIGCTTVATNLAVTLAAEKQRSVCLMDLVMRLGSVNTFLDLPASPTLSDFARNLKRADPSLLETGLIKHSSGVRVLTEPFRPASDTIAQADTERILNALAQAFNFVILDIPKELDETTLLALDKAHMVLFVTGMDIPSLKSAHRALETFERLGIYRKKIRLVLNRYAKSRLMNIESVEQTLGAKVFWTIPNDYRTAITALNQGLPILQTDENSAIAKSYLGLADAVTNSLSVSQVQKPEGEEKPSGLLARWIPFFNMPKGGVS